ncbi:hypothetical protein KCP75_07700 [Salmonella enterica subsp. enterica]|nr:hypothetical protein KCP75_07700 [Salmonella enterica subsp. enterica]
MLIVSTHFLPVYVLAGQYFNDMNTLLQDMIEIADILISPLQASTIEDAYAG